MKPQLLLGDIVSVEGMGNDRGQTFYMIVARITIDKVYGDMINSPTDHTLLKYGIQFGISADNYTFISRTLNPKASLKPMAI